MMFHRLIVQDWKKGLRSQGFYKNIVVTVVLSLFALYVAAFFLFLGFSLNELLEKINTNLNPTEIVNGVALYVLLLSLVLRYFLQPVDSFDRQLYLTLPVPRTQLTNFLLLKSFVNPINYFFLLVIVPFAVQSVAVSYSWFVGLRFVAAFTFWGWFDSLLIAYVKRRFGTGLWGVLLILCVLIAAGVVDFLGIFSFFRLSRALFDFVVFHPLGLLLPVCLVIVAFSMNKWLLRKSYYLKDEEYGTPKFRLLASNLSFLHRFGVIGEMVGLEIKLIFRHRQTKNLLYLSSLFLFYGLIFYTAKVYGDHLYILFLCAMFLTGIWMMLFGQWVYGWDSRHFDGLLTQNIPLKRYVESNYFLLVGLSVLCFLLTTPYFFFGERIVILHIGAFLYNVGINVYLLLLFATYHKRRVDLSKSSPVNYKSTTYKSFLFLLFMLLLPIAFVMILTLWVSLEWALWILALMGLGGVVFRKALLRGCTNQFISRKYKMAEGFRVNS